MTQPRWPALRDRWAIELTNRDLKQYLGSNTPVLGRRRPSASSLCRLALLAIWHWFLTTHPHSRPGSTGPWYHQARPSFADAWPLFEATPGLQFSTLRSRLNPPNCDQSHLRIGTRSLITSRSAKSTDAELLKMALGLLQ